MNLTSKKVIKSLLKGEGIRPLKRLGQNFLISSSVLDRIVKASELKQEDVVLEIGPGIGVLTCQLAERVKKVVAVEKDPKLVEILREILKDFRNVEVILDDILDPKIISYIRKKFVIRREYKVVSNLPYNIATEVIRKFLEIENPPKLMLLMVQKEVGQRICSSPPKMQRLAVLIQAAAEVKILEIVKKKYFWPQPKVDSAILQVKPLIDAERKLTEEDKNLFSKIVKAGFSQPRKQLINNLSKTLGLPREKIKTWLQQNNLQPTQRAESLSLNDWLNLTKSFDI